MEKPGPSPPSSQRPYNLISLLYFPDVVPNEYQGHRLSSCPDFLIKLPPELLIRNKGSGSLNCVVKGLPTAFVIWLYNQLNAEESVCYSVKNEDPSSCINVNNVGPGKGGSYVCKNISSAGDAERSTVTKGWHLHAFGPSARSGFFTPLIHTALHPHSQQRHTSSQGDTTSSTRS